MKKREITKLTKELNISEDYLDFMWEACALWEHSTIKSLVNQGISWRAMSYTTIERLPEIYYKILYEIFK